MQNNGMINQSFDHLTSHSTSFFKLVPLFKVDCVHSQNPQVGFCLLQQIEATLRTNIMTHFPFVSLSAPPLDIFYSLLLKWASEPST